MGATMPRRRYRGKHAERVRVHTAYIRADAGCSAQTLAAHCGTYIERIAKLVTAAAAIPDPSFIERVLAPLDAARLGIVAPALTPELIESVQACDLAEDLAEVRCLACMTLPKKRDWLAKVRAERGKLLLLELALLGSIEQEAER